MKSMAGFGFYPAGKDNIPALIVQDSSNLILREIVTTPNTSFHINMALVETPTEATPYILIGLYKDEEPQEIKKIYWVTAIVPPYELKFSMSKWLSELRKQPDLSLMLEVDDLPIKILSILGMEDIDKLFYVFEQALQKWNGVDERKGAIKYLNHKIEVEKRKFEDEINQEKSNLNPEESLIEKLHKKIISQPNFLSHLWRIANQNNTVLLQNYLNEWRENLVVDSLEDFLSTPGKNKDEEICKNWLYSQKCIEQHSKFKNKNIKLAVGISNDKSWNFVELNKNKIQYGSDLLAYAETYRYSLPHNWKTLITNDEILVTSPEIVKFHNIGNVPHRSQFKEISRILQFASLEQKFSIEQHNIIEVGKEGCFQIEFLPLKKGGTKCLFKVVVLQHETLNLILLGELDAAKGHISFLMPPPDKSVEGKYNLLLFIAAIAYRDLIVARHKIGEKTTNKNTTPKKNKNQNQDSKNLVRWIPRFKRQIDKDFADPKLLVERLKVIAPHMRIAHTRQLPDDHQRSTMAEQFANEYGWILPEGYTFVNASRINHFEGETAENVRSHFRSISLLDVLFESE